MQALSNAQPNKKQVAWGKILVLLERQFRAASVSQKKSAAQKYLDALLSLADDEQEHALLTEAAANYQAAGPAADAISKEAAEEVSAKLKSVRSKLTIKTRSDALKAQLMKKPDDAATATELVKLLTLDMDLPMEAIAYLDATGDRALQHIVPLAVKDDGAMSEAETLELAAWYRAQVKDAREEGKANALSHAATLYKNYLNLHTREDAARLTAKVALDEIQKVAASGAPAHRVVNLLKLVDLKRSVIAGGWEWTNDGLLCKEPGPSVRIKIPYEPPDEYDYRVEFTNTEAGDAPILNMTHAGAEFYWETGVKTCDFALVAEDVKGVPSPPGLIKPGRRMSITVKVRRAAVSAFVDDRLIMQMKTDYSDLSAPPRTGWDVGAGCFGIGVKQKAVIHRIDLIEISGMGKAPPGRD